MKIVAIISSQAFSLINFRGALISSLVKLNVRVYALAPDYSEELRQQIDALGAVPVDFHLARTGMNPLRDLLDMLNLAALLRRLAPNVTLGYFIKPVIYGTLAAWLAGVPRRVAMIEGLGYVFTSPGTGLSWRRKILRKAVSFLYRVALRCADKVIFLNKDDIAEFLKRGLVDGAKVVQLGGIGVDLVDWRYAPAVTRPTTFLLVARLLREKGISEYADAAKAVKALNPETRFILLGGLDPNPGGFGLSEVQAWVADGLLEWPGHVDVKPWLTQSSVFVLPSYREGLPRSTQEAMAMGRAIITTDAPGCRETVIHGVNGFLVPVRDVASLVVSMMKFVKDPALIQSMGFKSRRMAEDRFDVNKVNARLLQILGVE